MDRGAILTGLWVVPATGFVMLIPVAVFAARFWRTVETRHPEIWKGLGGPSLRPVSREQNRELRAFARKCAHGEFDDPELTSAARRMSRLGAVLNVLFVLGAAFVLVAGMATGM